MDPESFRTIFALCAATLTAILAGGVAGAVAARAAGPRGEARGARALAERAVDVAQATQERFSEIAADVRVLTASEHAAACEARHDQADGDRAALRRELMAIGEECTETLKRATHRLARARRAESHAEQLNDEPDGGEGHGQDAAPTGPQLVPDPPDDRHAEVERWRAAGW